MKIWILQTGEPVHGDTGNPRPMRGMNLANKLVEHGHQVVFWTSDFYHQEKRHRFGIAYTQIENKDLTLEFIPSPGYQGNISPQRFYDHVQMGKNFKTLLNKVSEAEYPDIIFMGYPPIEVAYHLAQWAVARDIPYLLDAKDQWPDYFVEKLPSPMRLIGRLAFAPYFKMAKYIFDKADGFSTMSDSFLSWMLQKAGRMHNTNDIITPLVSLSKATPDKAEHVDLLHEMGLDPAHSRRLVFAGTFSTAFDFVPVAEMARLLAEKHPDWEIILAGDGPEADKLNAIFTGQSNVRFVGWVQQASLKALYSHARAILAPYVQTSNFTDNLPNKIIDSIQYEKPVLCPLDGEVRAILATPDLDGHYHDGPSLMAKVEKLAIHGDGAEQRKKLGKLYKTNFDFDMVYDRLVQHLETMVKGHV